MSCCFMRVFSPPPPPFPEVFSAMPVVFEPLSVDAARVGFFAAEGERGGLAVVAVLLLLFVLSARGATEDPAAV